LATEVSEDTEICRKSLNLPNEFALLQIKFPMPVCIAGSNILSASVISVAFQLYECSPERTRFTPKKVKTNAANPMMAKIAAFRPRQPTVNLP
jgi:hypothetical protein